MVDRNKHRQIKRLPSPSTPEPFKNVDANPMRYTTQQVFHRIAALADESFCAGHTQDSVQFVETLYDFVDQATLPTVSRKRHVPRSVATRVVQLRHNNLPTTSFGMGCWRIAQAVAAHPDLKGVLEINVTGFGDELSIMHAVQEGSLDLAVVASSVASSICPEIGLLDAPFLLNDVNRGRAAFDGPLGHGYITLMKTSGINVLGWFENGLRQMTAHRPIRHPGDLRGLKLRVPQSRISAEAFASLGALTVPLPFDVVYDTLRDRQLEGQETPLVGIVETGLHEVQDCLSITSHSYSVGVVIASNELLNDLTEVQLQALRLCVREGTLTSQSVADRAASFGLKQLQRKGMTIISDLDSEGFRKAMQPYLEVLTSRFGLELISCIRDAGDEDRSAA